MQGCVISCGTVVFFQKSRNLSRSLLTNNSFYCGKSINFTRYHRRIDLFSHLTSDEKNIQQHFLAPLFSFRAKNIRKSQLYSLILICETGLYSDQLTHSKNNTSKKLFEDDYSIKDLDLFSLLLDDITEMGNPNAALASTP